MTKTVMFIFIVALVGIFMSLQDSIEAGSAKKIVDSEATRIAKEIDEIVGFKGVSNSGKVHLKRVLEIGRDEVPYNLTINDKGVVLLTLAQYPYEGTMGLSRFGIMMDKTGGTDIVCNPQQVWDGVTFDIEKESKYEYRNTVHAVYYIVDVKLDASESCGNFMSFQEEYRET